MMAVLAAADREPLRRGGVEIKYSNHDSRSDDCERKTWNALAGFEQKNSRECAGADCKRRPVHLSTEDALGDPHEIAQWTGAIN
jgi:hypothetical protein